MDLLVSRPKLFQILRVQHEMLQRDLVFRQLLLVAHTAVPQTRTQVGAGEYCSPSFVRDNKIGLWARQHWPSPKDEPCRLLAGLSSQWCSSEWVISLCLPFLDIFCPTSPCFTYRRQRPSHEGFGVPVLDGGLGAFPRALLWQNGARHTFTALPEVRFGDQRVHHGSCWENENQWSLAVQCHHVKCVSILQLLASVAFHCTPLLILCTLKTCIQSSSQALPRLSHSQMY